MFPDQPVLDNFDTPFSRYNIWTRIQRSKFTWLCWYGGIMTLAGVLGLLMIRQDPQPAYLGWILYLIGAGMILYRPRYGVYLILFFSLIGDIVLMPWYPFNKGFSSYESIFFLSRSLIFSPLEIYILLTIVSWLLRGIVTRDLKFYKGGLFWPAVGFISFVIIGLVYGLINGGNFNIALWQVRPLFYLVIIMFLAGNLLETRAHVSNVMWAIMLGLFIKSIAGNVVYFIVNRGNLSGIESITEHAASVQLNTMFIFALAVWLYKCSWPKRLLLPLMLPIVGITYISSQRRAAMLALIIGIILFSVILYKENRRVFWLVVPVTAGVFGLFVLAFWNSSSTLGLPAQAVKSVISPGHLSARDQSSDIYRYIENIDLLFTLHMKPITGIGFGQPFYVLVPLPDISWFSQWQYYPHNSIVWIWLCTGLGGFLAMLFFVGMAINSGAKLILRLPQGELRAIALTATLYIVMHYVYAYVDISWDIESMLYVGAMMGLIGSLEVIALKPLEIKPKRWPWQPEPRLEVAPILQERGGHFAQN